ncbi:hypothetical protein GOV10_04010 [Candidatus Woesearchaeota archaeon]|nr:hypothetical protein [Candidatus Woesearchaeota archaeon]
MIETRLTFEGRPFLIEAYDSETDVVIGEYFLNKTFDCDLLVHTRFEGNIHTTENGELGLGIGSALLDKAVQVLEDYATRKNRRVTHDVVFKDCAPTYLPAMFERRGYARHSKKLYSLSFQPRPKEPPFSHLEEQVKEKFRNVKNKIPFVN